MTSKQQQQKPKIKLYHNDKEKSQSPQYDSHGSQLKLRVSSKKTWELDTTTIERQIQIGPKRTLWQSIVYLIWKFLIKMTVNERTSLLRNGNGVYKEKDKLIIPMPKDPIFTFEPFWDALSLEELLPYQDEPWWQRLRSTLLYSFWMLVILTFVTACAMAYLHGDNSCKAVKPLVTSSSLFMVDPMTSSTIINEILSVSKLAT